MFNIQIEIMDNKAEMKKFYVNQIMNSIDKIYTKDSDIYQQTKCGLMRLNFIGITSLMTMLSSVIPFKIEVKK